MGDYVLGDICHCVRCKKLVYFNEEKRVNCFVWHTACFKCANPNCKRNLDNRNLTIYNNEVYCNHCYTKICTGKDFRPHLNCLRPLERNSNKTGCSERRTSSDSLSTQEISSEKCSKIAIEVRKEHHYYNLPRQTPKLIIHHDVCARCSKNVFYAEKMVGAGQIWHKSCFSCKLCRKPLDSYTVCERSGEIFCSGCCNKIIGPQGYGFGCGAGTLKSPYDKPKI